MIDARDALRNELESRGYRVADDTMAARRGLYVEGRGDLAAGLFEFKDAVEEAIETLYQGSWTEGLPPRFVVLPGAAVGDPSFELLEQMHLIPLIYEVVDDQVSFPELDAVLAKLRA